MMRTSLIMLCHKTEAAAADSGPGSYARLLGRLPLYVYTVLTLFNMPLEADKSNGMCPPKVSDDRSGKLPGIL